MITLTRQRVRDKLTLVGKNGIITRMDASELVITRTYKQLIPKLYKLEIIMQYNSVLRSLSEVDQAINLLLSLNLFPHSDRLKSWDTSKMIDIINKADRSSFILDVGCNSSPILPMLKRLGFKNLYGCDLSLSSSLMPLTEMHEEMAFNLSIQNLEKTDFANNMFDYITSLSVIEHGINIQEYFKEMSRILKEGGMLLTSTDYWDDKVINTVNIFSTNSPDTIFSRDELEDMIRIAEQNGFMLTDPIDFTCEDKIVYWHAIRLNYTFIFFALKKGEGFKH